MKINFISFYKMDIYEFLLKLLCELHYDFIEENKEYINIKNAIIAGAFTAKIKTDHSKKIPHVDKNISDINIDLIDKFIDMSNKIQRFNFSLQDEPFYCYRVIDNDSILNNKINSIINKNPIPVSATFDIKMAREWSHLKDNSSILKIELRRDINYVILDKLYERDSEIVLPPGDVLIDDKDADYYICSYHIVNYRIVKCTEEGLLCRCDDNKFCIFTQEEINSISKMNVKFSGKRPTFRKRRN